MKDRPVLLTDPVILPPSTARALDGVAEVTVVGGTAAVTEPVAAAVSARGPEFRRLAGGTRYGTAVAVAEAVDDRTQDAATVWAATGSGWPDAIAAGPVVAAAGAPLVLIDGTAAGGDAETGAWLARRAESLRAGTVVGGTAVARDEAVARLAARIT